MVRSVCFLLVFLFVTPMASAKTKHEELFYNDSEIDQFIEDFPVLVDFGFKKQSRNIQYSARFKPSDMNKLRRETRQVDIERYKNIAQDKLLSNFTPDEINRLVKWQQSGFGKRLNRLITFSHTADGMDQMKSYFLRQNPTKKNRLDDIRILAKHQREIEILINVAAQTQTAIQGAIDTVSHDRPRSYRTLFNLNKKQALANQDIAKKFVYADLVYTYRTLLDRDMRKYLEFAQSPLGQKYYKVRQKVITSVVTMMSQDLVKAYAGIIKSDQQEEYEDIDPQAAYQAEFERGKKLYQAKNYAGAFAIFEQVGKKGHAEAQYYLGKMHRSGQHTVLNEMVAYAWFSVAGHQGHKAAKKITNQMLSNFSMVTLSKAGRLSRQYIKDYHADAEKRRKKAERDAIERKKFEAELAANKARIEKQKALNNQSSEEKLRRKKLAKRTAKHRELLIERYPLPELMTKPPEIVTEAK